MKATNNQRALAEAVANAIAGFIMGILMNLYIVPPVLGIEHSSVTLEMSIILALIFGSVSIIRSFILRKAFSKYVKRDWSLW